MKRNGSNMANPMQYMLISVWISLIYWDFDLVFKLGFVTHFLFWVFIFLFLGMYFLDYRQIFIWQIRFLAYVMSTLHMLYREI